MPAFVPVTRLYTWLCSDRQWGSCEVDRSTRGWRHGWRRGWCHAWCHGRPGERVVAATLHHVLFGRPTPSGQPGKETRGPYFTHFVRSSCQNLTVDEKI